MIGSTDMSTPVTRGEMRAEFEQFEIRLEHKLEQLEIRLEQKLEQKLDQKLDQKLEQKLAHLATKVELEIWGGALLARIESGEQRLLKTLLERIDSSERRLLAELARHTKASHEEMTKQFSILDDEYADLPRRVRRLEARVFAYKRR